MVMVNLYAMFCIACVNGGVYTHGLRSTLMPCRQLIDVTAECRSLELLLAAISLTYPSSRVVLREGKFRLQNFSS